MKDEDDGGVELTGSEPKKLTDIAEIRRKVEERRAAEASGEGPGPDMKGGSGGGITSAFLRKCLNANELGDGMLYCAHHAGQFIFVKNSGVWYRWSGHFWERDVLDTAVSGVEALSVLYLDEAKRLVSDIDKAIKAKNKDAVSALEALQDKIYKRVIRLRSDRGRVNCIKFTHTNPENAIAVTGDEFDRDPWLLGCLNGVIDLRTGQLRPGRREDYITKVAPVEWLGLDHPAPLWERFLSEILIGDQATIDFLSRLLGYAVTGQTIEHILPIFVGQGRNGKGTIIEILFHVMGPLAAPIPSEMLLDQGRIRSSSGPSPDIMALQGLRLAVAAESDEGRRFSQSKIKWLTGDDSLTGRNPHDRESTTFRPSHKLLLMTNHEPNASADDFAFWERVLMIPFTISFVNRVAVYENERPADIHLRQKLKAEAPGILAWLVRGCLAWQRHGLNPPDAVRKATKEYRRDQDRLSDWIEDRCYLDPVASGQAAALYDDFKEWWDKNVSKKIPSQHRFGKWMTRRFKKEKAGVFTYYGIGLLSSLGRLGE